MRRTTVVMAVGLLVSAPLRAAEDRFASQVRPLLDRYCVACHNAEKAKAGVALHAAADKSAIVADRRLWQRVVDQVDAGIMPPDGEPQPTDDERATLAGVVEDLLAARDCTIEQPGRVTLRRLNRVEYLNTVRDLLGVEVPRPEMLPLDDVGYGFDTIGDVLSLPPLLLEKYLTLAELVSERAIQIPRIDNGLLARWEPRAWDGAPPNGRLNSNLEVSRRYRFPERGKYRLVVTAHGERAGSELPRLVVKLDGQPLRSFDVEATADAPGSYAVEIPVKAPSERILSLAFVNDYYQPDSPDPKLRGDRNLILHGAELFGSPMPPTWPVRVWRPDQIAGGNPSAHGRTLASNGEFQLEIEAPVEGVYYLTVSASGDQAGPEPARMALRLAGRQLRVVDVPSSPQNPSTYNLSLNLRKGKNAVALAFVNDYYQPDSPDPKLKGDRNLHIHRVELLATTPLATSAAHRRLIPRAPKSPADWSAAAREPLAAFMTRAYRRPVRPEEVERLLKLVETARDDGETFERGIQLAVQAVLVSPHFLYRVEVDRRASGNRPGSAPVRPLTGYELASRLSYFLWATMPDDELMRLAREDRLQDDRVLEAQVRRMLKDARSRALVDHFAGQWLQLRKLDAVTPDPARFPQFDAELRQAMRAETEHFLEAIIRQDRPLLDLLDAPYTFLNERLAQHYGIPGVTGSAFREVALPPGSHRGGLLAQASILTLTSNPGRTSPVKRGKYILEQILGTPPPPAPADVPPLEDDKAQGPLRGTLRQRLEQHRSNPACAGCHARLDPLGFGLENYDAIGAWRERDGDAPVDASGSLPGGRSFSGADELRRLLRADQAERFLRNLTEKLLIYGLGRGLEPADACAVDAVVEKARSGGLTFSGLIVEIVKSDPFRKRSLEELVLQ
ncbi:MAG: hypothetical protein KatS3mg108_3798 [Isosphaeraceae bacterium]|nr:MAG: hypothetical protein KatS3mg108_3798 [Isosphaeraceae bacterium]